MPEGKKQIDPERPPQRKHPTQLQTTKVGNTNGTNKEGFLRLVNKLRTVPKGTETMSQRIQWHRRATLF